MDSVKARPLQNVEFVLILCTFMNFMLNPAYVIVRDQSFMLPATEAYCACPCMRRAARAT